MMVGTSLLQDGLPPKRPATVLSLNGAVPGFYIAPIVLWKLRCLLQVSRPLTDVPPVVVRTPELIAAQTPTLEAQVVLLLHPPIT